jgi:Ni,Fe-hydrogenase maturation factor
MDIYDSTDINTQKIQISKTFGQQNDNLTIQIENKENEMNIIIDATKSENDKYSINLGITSADIEVSADVNIDIKFDSNITITELTDSNSVIINDKSSEEINQIIQTAVKLIQEKEGIEDTVLGVFQSIITMNEELFEKATNAAKEAENAIEAEQQLSQGMEQLDEMVRTTNN